IDSDLSFREALGRVRDSVLAAHARQELPFEILAARLVEEESFDPGSLVQVFFVLQNAISAPLKVPDVAVQSLANASPGGQPGLPIGRTSLRLTLKERPAGLSRWWAHQDHPFAAAPAPP